MLLQKMAKRMYRTKILRKNKVDKTFHVCDMQKKWAPL